MMKKTYIGIYAAIALFIILGTVVWFAYGIISDSDQGEIDAKNTFAYFAKSAMKLAEEGSFTEKAYKDKLIELAKESGMKAFIISNLKSQALISWPRNSKLIVSDNVKGVHIEPDGFFVKTFNVQVKVKTLQGYEKPIAITGALSTLKPANIFILSRSAFFIVLTVLILTFLMLLLQNILSSGQKVYAEVNTKPKFPSSNLEPETAPYNSEPYTAYNVQEVKAPENTNMEMDKDETYTAYDDDDIAVPEETDATASYTETYNENYGNSYSNAESKTYTLEDLDDLTITKNMPYEAKPDDNTLASEESVKAHNVPMNENPYETIENNFENSESESPRVYSKRTGVNEESSLSIVLESELKRAAASENDLAIVMVKLKDLTLESLVAKRIVELLYGIVKSKDMIFEYEDDGFATILYDKDLDSAMQESENIYHSIQSILDEYDISEPIAIGLTTRAGRLIDADRMLEESRAAIARAIRSADDPIVAFRVNEKKYREFIAEH